MVRSYQAERTSAGHAHAGDGEQVGSARRSSVDGAEAGKWTERPPIHFEWLALRNRQVGGAEGSSSAALALSSNEDISRK